MKATMPGADRSFAAPWLMMLALVVGCSESAESVGARLQRECESIIDTADALSSPLWFTNQEIIDVLAKDPKIRPRLGNAYYDKWEKYRDEHPHEWKAAYDEVLKAKQAGYARNGRAKKIAECVMQRGAQRASR